MAPCLREMEAAVDTDRGMSPTRIDRTLMREGAVSLCLVTVPREVKSVTLVTAPVAMSTSARFLLSRA